MSEELYEDFDDLIRDATLMREALIWCWQGDPELLTDEHWGAVENFGRKMGLDDER